MKMFEEALIYATIMHQGVVRKFGGIPYIMHPIEVAQILATMTDDEEIMTAGILHDIVEDTDGTLIEIEKRFGKRVADLVASESEYKHPELDPCASWKIRKEESLNVLRTSDDIGVKMLWLADKLANLRSLSRVHSEQGEAMWQGLHQKDPAMHCWYYKSVAEAVELKLNKTGAFKEFIKHINFMWPGTFDSDKARYKKYREVSLDGCKFIARGAKGDVYRYNEEFVIKVFNNKNTYADIERETTLARKAFIREIPTAISFGIVSVGDCYGAMYELVEADTISSYIARNPTQVDTYAKIMADLAHTIHATEVTEEDGFPDCMERLRPYILGGVGREDQNLGMRLLLLFDRLPRANTLVHGDFHTGNVFLAWGEPLIIDMDRISVGHPIAELSDLYYFYVTLGEDDPAVVENFMGFPYEIAREFFRRFLVHYLGTDDEAKLAEVTDKASILAYSRAIRMLRKKGMPSEDDREKIERYVGRIADLLDRVDSLLI